MRRRRLISQRVIRPEAAQVVDFQAIRWFASTDLGKRLAMPGLQIFRELSIAFPSPQNTGELVRGRIDLVIVENGKLTVIDYKTDRVNRENLPERSEFYRPQVAAYSSQIAKITQVNDYESYLVFLQPRQVVQV